MPNHWLPEGAPRGGSMRAAAKSTDSRPETRRATSAACSSSACSARYVTRVWTMGMAYTPECGSPLRRNSAEVHPVIGEEREAEPALGMRLAELVDAICQHEEHARAVLGSGHVAEHVAFDQVRGEGAVRRGPAFEVEEEVVVRLVQ